MAFTAVLTFDKDGDPLLVAPNDNVQFNLTVTNTDGADVTLTAIEPYIATSAGVRTNELPIRVSPVTIGRSQVQSAYGNYTETLSTVATGRYFKFTKAAGTAVKTQNGSPLFRTDCTPYTAWASDADAVEYNGRLTPPAEMVLDVVAANTGVNIYPFTVTVCASPAKQAGTFTFNVGCIIRYSTSILAASEIPVIVTTPTRYLEGGLDADGNHVTVFAQTPLPS